MPFSTAGTYRGPLSDSHSIRSSSLRLLRQTERVHGDLCVSGAAALARGGLRVEGERPRSPAASCTRERRGATTPWSARATGAPGRWPCRLHAAGCRGCAVVVEVAQPTPRLQRDPGARASSCHAAARARARAAAAATGARASSAEHLQSQHVVVENEGEGADVLHADGQ
jgi:hypothetical protein